MLRMTFNNINLYNSVFFVRRVGADAVFFFVADNKGRGCWRFMVETLYLHYEKIDFKPHNSCDVPRGGVTLRLGTKSQPYAPLHRKWRENVRGAGA